MFKFFDHLCYLFRLGVFEWVEIWRCMLFSASLFLNNFDFCIFFSLVRIKTPLFAESNDVDAPLFFRWKDLICLAVRDLLLYSACST